MRNISLHVRVSYLRMVLELYSIAYMISDLINWSYTSDNNFYIQVSVRQAALQLLQDALEGSGGGGPTSAYSEALRVVLRLGSADKSSIVRSAAANCLHAFALAGGPGIGSGGLEGCSALCVKVVLHKSSFKWYYHMTLSVNDKAYQTFICVNIGFGRPFTACEICLCVNIRSLTCPWTSSRCSGVTYIDNVTFFLCL